MSVKYGDPVYANDRIAGSLVRYGSFPVYVEYINEETGEAFCQVTTGGRKNIRVPYLDLDLTPVPLGNVNHRGSVFFARRIPKRRDWRQGLRANNLSIVSVTEQIRGNINFAHRDIANTILNKFPNLEICINSIECGEAESMAFSRYFSVGPKLERGYTLFYKTTCVGFIEIQDKQIIYELDEQHKYLNEFLQEELKIVQP